MANVFTPLPKCARYKTDCTNIIHRTVSSCKRTAKHAERKNDTMGKILKEFARNNFHAGVQNEKRSPEREKLCEQIFILQTELEEKLNSTEKSC